MAVDFSSLGFACLGLFLSFPPLPANVCLLGNVTMKGQQRGDGNNPVPFVLLVAHPITALGPFSTLLLSGAL